MTPIAPSGAGSLDESSGRSSILSRRTVLLVGAGAAAVAGLSACVPLNRSDTRTGHPSSSFPAGGGVADVTNVRITRDRYGVHVGPAIAVNPHNQSQLLAVCGVGAEASPSFIGAYRSQDGGTTWSAGGLPPQPEAGPAGDDLSVAFDADGRGYVCATRAGHSAHPDVNDPNASRAIYVWHTDDAGRTFSAPVTVLADEYCDHPWIAAGTGTHSHEVYIAWGANSAIAPAVGFTRSTDRGATFEAPRTVIPVADVPSLVSAGPEVATGPDGLIVAITDWTTEQGASGDQLGQVVAICSTDGGTTFSTPSRLGVEAAVIALPGDTLPNSMPTVAVSPDGRTIYAAFTTHQPRSDRSSIVLTVSRDLGASWSQPVVVTPGDARIYFQPRLAVDAGSRIALSAFAMTGGKVSQVVMRAAAENLRFDAPIQVSAPFDPRNSMASGGKHGAWWIGDCQGIAASDDTFHVVWNDTRTGTLELFTANIGS